MFLACRHSSTPRAGQCGQGCDGGPQQGPWGLPDHHTDRWQEAAWHDIPSSGQDILRCIAVEAPGSCKVHNTTSSQSHTSDACSSLYNCQATSPGYDAVFICLAAVMMCTCIPVYILVMLLPMLCTHGTCEGAAAPSKVFIIMRGTQCMHVSSCMARCCMGTIYLEGFVVHLSSVHVLYCNQHLAGAAANAFMQQGHQMSVW